MTMQKKRILIISYYFAPQNIIGAVRPTKLAKYLTRMGHDVTVVCSAGRNGEMDPTLERDLQEVQDVHIVREWNPLRDHYIRKRSQQKGASGTKTNVRTQNAAKMSWKGRLIDFVYMYLWWLADLNFAHCARQELKKLNGQYDVVFSTYTQYSSHMAAVKAKQMGLAKCWIADFRDEVNMNFSWQEGRKKRFLNMIRRHADLITAVSDGFLELMNFEACGRVLSNGFDREDLPAIQPERYEGFRVVYCGQLRDSRRFMGNRDITAMFRALKKLVEEGEIAKEDLHLVYAGREGALMRDYAASCGLEDCVEDLGWVSREESIRLQRSADILLMASLYMKEQRGILTGKLFEYLMMDKPIVCCMKGDLAGSGVKKLLMETGMGICCEQAAGEADEEALLAWLRSQVQTWKDGGNLLADKNTEAVEHYAYPQLASTLDGWIDELIQS